MKRSTRVRSYGDACGNRLLTRAALTGAVTVRERLPGNARTYLRIGAPKIAVIAIALAAALVAQGSRSVWDGVYTEDQARRGEQAYGQKCSSCHGTELLGADEAPPLAGAQFLSNYNGQTADDLFERIRVSMPADKPGTLSRQQIADIVAYIFRFNGFPAGPKELPTQAEVLKQIRIEATKPDNK